jgi:tetratricopeptide (TPR) repeat protein
MKSHFPIFQAAAVAGVALALGACGHVQYTHVAPGQSLGVALARKADLVRLASPPPGSMAGRMQAVEPDLPASDNLSRAAEAFSQGEFCMGAGKDDEAIAAYQQAVKIDPTFGDAWQRLAALYEKKGDNKKAMDAFRRAKKVARQ